MSASIFNGDAVKILKNKLRFKNNVDLELNTSTSNLETSNDFVAFKNTAKEIEVGDEIFETIGTGANSFDGLTVTNAGADFTIGAGAGHVVDHVAGTYDKVSWTAFTGELATAANGVTYVLITRAGAVRKQTTRPTAEERRDYIYLGRIITVAGTIVQAQDEVVSFLDSTNQIFDLAESLSIFNADGNIFTANGANLNINKSAGILYSKGTNFTVNIKNPHEVSIPAQTAATFAYITQLAGSTGADTTLIVPGSYDNAGTITSIPGSNNRATIQRIYLFPSGNIRIAYGQQFYNSLAEAVQSINTEDFIANPNIAGNGVLVGLLAVTKGATDLSDSSTAKFLRASKFGEATIGGSGLSVSSLQNAYDNSEAPEITLNTSLGALTVRDNATPIAAPLFEVQNNTGSADYLTVDVNGTTTTRLDVDTLRIDSNTISTVSGNQDITLTPNGTGSVIISSDLQVNGTTTTVNSATLDVTDSNITVNNSGNQATADANDAGLTVEMSDATDAIIHYDSTSSSNWKLGLVGSSVDIADISSTQTLTNKTVVAASNTITTAASGNLTATELNAALAELQADIDTRAVIGDIFSVNSNSGTFNASANETYIVDTSGGTATITLPAPTVNSFVRVKDNGNALANNITVNPNAAETIDGAASFVINSEYGSNTFVSDGTNWYVL